MTILQVEGILTPKQRSKNKSGHKTKTRQSANIDIAKMSSGNNVESCQAKLVWTQVFPKGMKIPTSTKRDDAIQSIGKDDNSTNKSDSQTKATKQKKSGCKMKGKKKLKHRHHNDVQR
jgi:hypothetical protein